MNYKPITIEKLKEFSEKFPDYSFGELLCSFLRGNIIKGKPSDAKNGWILDVEDKDFYTAIENAIINETENI